MHIQGVSILLTSQQVMGKVGRGSISILEGAMEHEVLFHFFESTCCRGQLGLVWPK